MTHPQPQQAPPPRMRPHPPPPTLRPTSTLSSCHPESKLDGKEPRKPRGRRRGRRAGIGNKPKRPLVETPPSSGTKSSKDTPHCDNLGTSRSSSPSLHAPDEFSSLPNSRDIPRTRHEAVFVHLERLEHLEGLRAAKAITSPEVPLLTPPQTAATCNGMNAHFASPGSNAEASWPSASRSNEWPTTPTLSPSFGRPSRRPAYIGSHLPIPTVNLPETKPFSLAKPDFGEIERSLPEAYNTDYPHPLTVYASPGVNPATVVASGYAPFLRELLETNPRAAMGGILADCGNEHMTAPALLLTQGGKDGCGIPEQLWLQLSSCAGVKVPIGAVLPAVMAGRGVSPRFLQVTSSDSSPCTDHCDIIPPPSRGVGTTSDNLESPLYSIFAKAQRIALSRPQTENPFTPEERETSKISEVLAKRRDSLPDLREGAKRKIDVFSAAVDEHYQLYPLVSPRRLEQCMADSGQSGQPCANSRPVSANLSASSAPGATHTRTQLPESPTKASRFQLSQYRRFSLGFDTLSTVAELDDDAHGSPLLENRPIEPIGAERHSRGQLPNKPVFQHRSSRIVGDSHKPNPCTPDRNGSIGRASSLVSPAESVFPATPLSTGDVFGDLLYTSSGISGGTCYSSRASSSDDEFTLSAKLHPKYLIRAQRVIHGSPPVSRVSSPTESKASRARLDPPVLSTTLDFSTGKSIWV
ncbi:hypothetical protein CC85DRAFT_292680 [Cutaneotrichosporon oleaginosum]|uniref:Uncharacterized protein n=1 Tax=Cutaneotrichosporon oleaginosum TaxID=879819 RepID=A0A0J0XK44_9TREE|nr:uncharacterized protein CC85DRAFT_292680 [Cutaneotrichosporon oleaginosum]KLT41468.1 hypothetical protein CC85DRAFT_292680 [Cutaneotrichosporon oleaginosum]TXT12228.1 hypothetical protein COLE_02638 [Cutaneotrichosporon oleaginosum]